MAVIKPHGPPPATRTSVSITSVSLIGNSGDNEVPNFLPLIYLGNQSILSLHELPDVSIRRRSSDAWRLSNAGRILSNAVTRFESRVLVLMDNAGYADTRLSHINLTRHLDLGGTRISELAKRARMTGAAMTELIDQCESIGLVERMSDPTDRRVRVVVFTDAGRLWLDAFGKSVKKAERELLDEVGSEIYTYLFGALAQYGSAIESIKSADKDR